MSGRRRAGTLEDVLAVENMLGICRRRRVKRPSGTGRRLEVSAIRRVPYR